MNKQKHSSVYSFVNKGSNSVERTGEVVNDEYSWKKHFIHYISVPTLENIATIGVVVQLWKLPDLRDELQRHGRNVYTVARSFDEVERKASEKVSNLLLPKVLKYKALDVVKPIVFEVLQWITLWRANYLSFSPTKCVDRIYWTMQGTVDKAKTLALCIAEFKNKETAYCMACKYCLENLLCGLWKEMPEELQKKYLYSESVYGSYTSHFVAYWTWSIKKDLDNVIWLIKRSDDCDIYNYRESIYRNMFALSVREGNVPAANYFWPKLTDEEISNSIIQWAEMAIKRRKRWKFCEYQKNNEYTDIFCFLLSKMSDRELQREMFPRYSDVILQALFFDWPWQKLLLPTIELMWDFLDGKVYVDLLRRVVREIEIGKNTEKLLKDLWYNSPLNFKRCFIQHMVKTGGSDVLLNLYKIEDYSTVMLILNDANIVEKRKIIFSALRSEKLFDLFYADKSSSLKILIEEISIQSEINDFKNNLIRQCGNKLCYFWIRDNDWQSVESLLEWCFTSEYEISLFKEEKIDKFAVFRSLACAGNYELVDRFMNWCFSTDEEIKQFKEDYLCGNSYMPMRANEVIVDLSYCDEAWNLFEKFMSYCFSSEEDISQFKELLTYDVMESMIHDIIVHAYNFEFCSTFLSWRFPSANEIYQFKRELILSSTGISMFCVLATKSPGSGECYNNWELVEQLCKWYYPCIKDVIIPLKQKCEENYWKFNAHYSKAMDWKSLSSLLDSVVR